jgi:transmembrane sensor
LNSGFDHISDDLLVKHLLGETDDEEALLVEAWTNASAANKKQFLDLQAIWQESKRLAATSSIDEDAAWNRFQARLNQPKQKAVVRQMNPRSWLRAVAIFLIVAGTTYISYTLLRERPVQNLVVASGKAAVTDTLPDGSVVTLNKNSELDYPSTFKGETRKVTMKGEAFFHVSADKKKPFIINVNDVTIRVVGTSFNVRSVNGITEVIVETGIVQVTHHNRTVELHKDEKIKVQQRDSALVKDKVQDRLYNYYRSKQFVCDNTPLWKFVQILNEAYDANIVIDDPKLRGLSLTAPFDNESLDRILEVIHETFNIKVIKEQDRIILQ